ncbi:MAG: polyhydroxyalkanoic acid system family protein [Planctomycetaceae bacterium]|nr:polyhydroxyalkanoic acid system family protein [Planctomycetaceae bacterium]
MPKLSLDIPHSLGQEEALRRLKVKFAAALSQYGDRVSDYREQWEDHTFSFGFKTLGMSVSGTVAVEPEYIRLAASLPLAAMLVKGAIEEQLRREMDRLLAAAT